LAGWKTIAKGVHESSCIKFVESMNKKYHLTDGRYKPPIFEMVQQEFYDRTR
jgi:hypothetical protein